MINKHYSNCWLKIFFTEEADSLKFSFCRVSKDRNSNFHLNTSSTMITFLKRGGAKEDITFACKVKENRT